MSSVSELRKRRTATTGTMESDEASLSVDTRPTIRLGVAVLVLGLGGFITWAMWAPLDEGVPVPATVVIDTKRKAIQHSGGGSVERVLVREGQHVRKGELLVEMNEATTRASFESVRQNYMAQRAAENRLLAEVEGKPSIQFHADLLASAGDPYVRQHMISQGALFDSRRNALQAELAGILSASRAAIVRALDALRDLASPQVRVWRDGRRTVIPARELVPGDWIAVGEGEPFANRIDWVWYEIWHHQGRRARARRWLSGACRWIRRVAFTWATMSETLWRAWRQAWARWLQLMGIWVSRPMCRAGMPIYTLIHLPCC